MTDLNEIIKKFRSKAIKLLEEYSPIALAVFFMLIFFPVGRTTGGMLATLFCIVPGIAFALLSPKTIIRNPVFWCIFLFVAWFSLQDIRGELPLRGWVLKEAFLMAVKITAPLIIFSLIRPQRRLFPWAVIAILLSASVRCIYSLITFYAEAPFPAARFGGMGHPVGTSHLTGLIAVLAGAFFLQRSQKIDWKHWIALASLPVTMLTAFYTHSRSTFLALLFMTALTAVGIRGRIKKTLLLWAAVTLSVTLYLLSMYTLPQRTEPISTIKSAPNRVYDIRSEGVLSSGENQKLAAWARIDIWKDHFSRMDSPAKWVIGNGLGRNKFVREASPEAARWYYNDDEKGYLLMTHSGYIWSLYFGGIIGFILLAALLTTAGLRALLCSIKNGYTIPLALLTFGAIWMLADGHSLLVNYGNIYLSVWIPIGLSAGLRTKDEGKT